MEPKVKSVFDRLKIEALDPRNRLAVLWIPAISMVPLANMIVLRGWREEILRRLSREEREVLPEPDLGRFLVLGVQSWLVTLILVAVPITLSLSLAEPRQFLHLLVDVAVAGPEAWQSLALMLYFFISGVVEEPLKSMAEIPWTSLVLQASIVTALLAVIMLVDQLLAACSTAYGTSKFALGRALKTCIESPSAVLQGLGLRFAVLGGLAFCMAVSVLAGPAFLIAVLFAPAVYYFLTAATLGGLVSALARAEVTIADPSAMPDLPAPAAARIKTGA